MTKYTVAAGQRGVKPEEKQVAPIWRGIGCIMMVVIPIVSYLIARWAIGFAVDKGYAIPYQLMGNVVLPPEVYQAGLGSVADFITRQDNLYAVLLLTVMLIVAMGGLLSVVYAFIYQVAGPPRYGPLDVEAPKGRVRRYKR